MARPSYPHTWSPGHPLVPPGMSRPYVGTHRLVLWEKIGPGTHPCHHCGTPVTWRPGDGLTVPDALIADHLDRDHTNNDPSNLVPACRSCSNYNRRVALQPGEIVVRWGNTLTRGERRTCDRDGCVVTFDVPHSSRKRFCSHRCANARHRRH